MNRKYYAIGLLMVLAACAGRAGADDTPLLTTSGDANAVRWQINTTGTLNQIADDGVYRDVAELFINNESATFSGPKPEIAPNGEIILADMTAKTFVLTRRLLVSKDGRTVRIVDVIRNNANHPLHIWYCSHVKTTLTKSKLTVAADAQELSCAAVDQQGKCLVECFGGEDGQYGPEMDAAEGKDGVVSRFIVAAAPGATIAIAHFHALPADENASALLTPTGFAATLSDVPVAIRRAIVNFQIAGGAGAETPASSELDQIELRSGERMSGTLKTPTFEIHGVYGAVTVPADHVASLSDTAGATARETITMRDGTQLTGNLVGAGVEFGRGQDKPATIPWTEITRLTLRGPASQPTTGPSVPVWIDTSAGDHLLIRPPTGTLSLQTNYGKIDVPMALIAEVAMGAKVPVDQTRLLDGSYLGGLVSAESLDCQLADAGSSPLHLPVSSINLIHLGSAAAPGKTGMHLSGDDCMLGTVQSDLHLQTNFNQIAIAAKDVVQMHCLNASTAEFSVTTGDGTTLSGALAETAVKFRTTGGLDVTLPASMITRYAAPGK